MRRYTPENLTSLPPNNIFVWGSNQYGRNGAGSSAAAVKYFGAKDGCPIGLVGQSYGIITKSFNDISVTVEDIRVQVEALYSFARLRPDLTFWVTKIGCGRAAHSIIAIGDMFENLECKRPDNIILPHEFDINSTYG